MTMTPACRRLDELMFAFIGEDLIPGAVVYVARCNETLVFQAYGHRTLCPQRLPMELATVFDLASLTKPVACAASVLLLAERGVLRLEYPVEAYIPRFGRRGKETVTVEQLLLHISGLPAESAPTIFENGFDASIESVSGTELINMPGESFLYSDIGYFVLGALVEYVDGRRLDRFAREELFVPLGMANTDFAPVTKSRCASTGPLDGRSPTGEVHDPVARALGGISGHAGLFSIADDLAKFCRMILSRGEHLGQQVLAKRTVKAMLTAIKLPNAAGLRSYTFDCATCFSSAWSPRIPIGSSFGHTGFTGTMLWLHPELGHFALLLTNSVHGRDGNRIRDLRRGLIDWIASVLTI